MLLGFDRCHQLANLVALVRLIFLGRARPIILTITWALTLPRRAFVRRTRQVLQRCTEFFLAERATLVRIGFIECPLQRSAAFRAWTAFAITGRTRWTTFAVTGRTRRTTFTVTGRTGRTAFAVTGRTRRTRFTITGRTRRTRFTITGRTGRATFGVTGGTRAVPAFGAVVVQRDHAAHEFRTGQLLVVVLVHALEQRGGRRARRWTLAFAFRALTGRQQAGQGKGQQRGQGTEGHGGLLGNRGGTPSGGALAKAYHANMTPR
jgi:hypothetical protein